LQEMMMANSKECDGVFDVDTFIGGVEDQGPF
jgi:hypothetical protein